MKLAYLVPLLLAVSPPLVAADRLPSDVPDDPAWAPLSRLGGAANCMDPASPWRPWCIAVDWQKGMAPDLPAGKVLVGMTVELEDGKDFAAAIRDKVGFTAVAISKDGKVKVSNVNPSSDDDKKQIAEAIFNTAAVFKGKSKKAKLPKDLGGYLKALKGEYKATRTQGAWAWTGASAGRARKVGDFWVVIETPKAGKGIWATILTDAWE